MYHSKKDLMTNKELKQKLIDNSSIILSYQLAFEHYCSNRGKENQEIDMSYIAINKFRKNKTLNDLMENIRQSDNLIIELKKVVKKLGEEKFTIYEDGEILYNWDKKI